jgi:hypothetical protein
MKRCQFPNVWSKVASVANKRTKLGGAPLRGRYSPLWEPLAYSIAVHLFSLNPSKYTGPKRGPLMWTMCLLVSPSPIRDTGGRIWNMFVVTMGREIRGTSVTVPTTGSPSAALLVTPSVRGDMPTIVFGYSATLEVGSDCSSGIK